MRAALVALQPFDAHATVDMRRVALELDGLLCAALWRLHRSCPVSSVIHE